MGLYQVTRGAVDRRMSKTIELWIVAIVAVLAVTGAYFWLQEHDQRIAAEATI